MTKEKSFDIGLSLVDVIYGVVFAYGFNLINSTHNYFELFRFFFAYLILIIDWFYSHQTYQKNLYQKKFIILDLLILFSFSRILAYSITENSIFYFWIALAFIIYLFWDRISQTIWHQPFRQLITNMIGDGIGAVSFLIIWILVNQNPNFANNIWLAIISTAVYLIAIGFWYFKPKRKTPHLNGA